MRFSAPCLAGFGLSIILLSVAGWASTGGQYRSLRPVDASSPFTFQQALPAIPGDIGRRYRAIDTGGSATCAIRARDRGIDCWGLNELGQASPPLTGRFRQLSVGGYVGCALTTARRLVCWGTGKQPARPGGEQPALCRGQRRG